MLSSLTSFMFHLLEGGVLDAMSLLTWYILARQLAIATPDTSDFHWQVMQCVSLATASTVCILFVHAYIVNGESVILSPPIVHIPRPSKVDDRFDRSQPIMPLPRVSGVNKSICS